MIQRRHVLLPVKQEIGFPPPGGVRYVQLGKLVLLQSWDDCVESKAEIHKQYPGVGSCSSGARGHQNTHEFQM